MKEGATMYRNSEHGNHSSLNFRPILLELSHKIRYRMLWLGCLVLSPISLLSIATPKLKTLGPPHFTYGVGVRLCPAFKISNRIIYALILRIIVEFRIVADESNPPNVDLIEFRVGAGEFVKSPQDFKLKILREKGKMEILLWLRGWKVSDRNYKMQVN